MFREGKLPYRALLSLLTLVEVIAGRHSLVAILFVALMCTSFVAAIRAQDGGEGPITETSEVESTTEQSGTTYTEDIELPEVENGTEESDTADEDVELPIGVELAARFHEMVEAHKAEIRAIIEEFKFNNSKNHEERLEIIEAYHNDSRLRMEEIKTQKKDLCALFDNGTIDHDEFVAGMRLLRARLKGSERMVEKLGWQLSEVAKKAAHQHRQKAQMLKELNQQMRDEMKAAHREMKEQSKTRGPSWKKNETTTETTSTGKKSGGKGKGKKKDGPGAGPGGDS